MTPPSPPDASTRRRLFPDWYRATATLTLGILLVLAVAYALGASGISFKGAAIDFDRKHDRQLYKIDDKKAFQVDSDGRVAIVRYAAVEPVVLPCGCYEGRKAFVISAGYRKGNWVYTRYPIKGFATAVNVKTGAVLEGDDVPEHLEIDGALALADYREHGFVFDSDHEFSGRDVVGAYEPMSTSKSGCITVLLAGYVLLALLAVVAPFAWLQQRARNRAA